MKKKIIKGLSDMSYNSSSRAHKRNGVYALDLFEYRLVRKQNEIQCLVHHDVYYKMVF